MLKILKLLPEISIRDFFRKYSKEKLRRDLVAGLTVAIVALPQSMAYAVIAGVNPKYGLYAAIIPVIISSLFGSSKFLIAGPTNAISMVLSSTMASVFIAGQAMDSLPENEKLTLLFLMAFLVGVIQLAMGIAKMGALVSFVSHSVVIGFTAGAGFLIAFNQLKNLLGLVLPSHPEFLENLWETFSNLQATNHYALGIGVFTIVFVLLAKRISPKIPGSLLALILSAIAVKWLDLEGGVKLIGAIPSTLPPFSHPIISLEYFRILFLPAMAVAILGLVEALSIAKSIASESGERIDGNREFLAQGLANIGAAFSSAIPGSGSFTRSAVNFQSGATTRLAGVFSGILVLCVLVLFASWAKYIPVASLAGILMVIAYSMINKEALVFSWKATRSDRLVLIMTFLSTLFLELEVAVFVGVILSIILFLRKISHPQMAEVFPREQDNKFYPDLDSDRQCPQINIFQIDGALFFGAIDELEDYLHIINKKKNKVVIMRMKGVKLTDATSAHELKKFLNECKKRDNRLVFAGTSPYVRKVFDRSGLTDIIGRKNLAKDTTAAISLAINSYADKDICAKCQKKIFLECPGR